MILELQLLHKAGLSDMIDSRIHTETKRKHSLRDPETNSSKSQALR